jgi:hypothetical protein
MGVHFSIVVDTVSICIWVRRVTPMRINFFTIVESISVRISDRWVTSRSRFRIVREPITVGVLCGRSVAFRNRLNDVLRAIWSHPDNGRTFPRRDRHTVTNGGELRHNGPGIIRNVDFIDVARVEQCDFNATSSGFNIDPGRSRS